jgi:hypothetical protein
MKLKSINKFFKNSTPNSPFNNSNLILDKEKLKEKVSLSQNYLLKKLSPRYILTSVDDFFFERIPYLNSKGFLTRFINIANVRKYFYLYSFLHLNLRKIKQSGFPMQFQ